MRGSSPHTRGAHPVVLRHGDRFVDHPRIRGEHMPWGDSGGQHPGSSPHTRGAPTATAWSALSPSDHPRIRGEHRRALATATGGRGSSPHTRGALETHPITSLSLGIIPAYAGSTTCCRTPLSCSGDHPRIRGEHRMGPTSSSSAAGSSPHTRGAPLRDVLLPRNRGIIPAYAGSTPKFGRRHQQMQDHPRIRGEHHSLSPPGW